MPVPDEHNKAVYSELHDEIISKRFQSSSPIRRYAHRMQYQDFVDLVPAGATVIDVGCGEGVLSVLLAKKGCIVTGVDLSEPNVAAAKAYAESEGVGDRVTFLVGDAEQVPVPDASFDYAVSSHVLEHVPDFVQGVRELNRIASTKVIAAIPTCLNLCSWVQLGGDKYWTFSRHTPYAIFFGGLRVLWALITGQEGVNETYAGHADLIHIFRFPWRGKQLLEQGGLEVKRYGASALVLPYFSFLLPIAKLFQRWSFAPLLRNCGYGTTYVCTPKR